MALNLPNKYPGRFDATSTDYPQGKFKNRTSPTAQDGSYLERDWLNDWGGFFGALLHNAGVTPNETVDTAQSSQFYDALSSIVGASSRVGQYKNATAVTASSTSLTSSQVGQAFLFTTAASTIALPAASGVAAGGAYKLHTSAGFTLSVTGGGAMQAGNASVTSLSVPAGTEVLAVSTGVAWWVFGSGTIANSALFTGLKASNGWRKTPDGFIEQWGSLTINTTSEITVTLPVPFPTGALNYQLSTGVDAAGWPGPFGIKPGADPKTQVIVKLTTSVAAPNLSFFWKVIGY